MSNSEIKLYRAWNLHTRAFHWINFLCVILLSILGLIMLNKSAIGTVHVYGVYLLWVPVLIHMIAVFRAEVRGDSSLISSMFSGKKYLPRPPVDQ